MPPSSPTALNVGGMERQRNPPRHSGAREEARPGMTRGKICSGVLTRIRNLPILIVRDDRTCPARGGLRPLRLNPAVFCVLRASCSHTAISGHAKREPQMRNRASGNLEISMLRIARNDVVPKSKPPVCFRKRAARYPQDLWGAYA